jgi:hypothetical protein
LECPVLQLLRWNLPCLRTWLILLPVTRWHSCPWKCAELTNSIRRLLSITTGRTLWKCFFKHTKCSVDKLVLFTILDHSSPEKRNQTDHSIETPQDNEHEVGQYCGTADISLL